MRFILGLIFIFSSVMLHAKYTFLGFSEDGKYCAYTWEDFNARQDYELECRVLDVEANQYAGEKLRVKINVWQIMKAAVDSSPDQFGMGPVLAHRALDREIEGLLQQFNIRSGNIGDRAFYFSLEGKPLRLIDQLKILSTDFKVEKESGTIRTYTLNLEERWAYSDRNETGDPRIFTLSLSRNNNSKILQQDKRLNAYRKDPLAYSISSIYVYQGRLAVFLESVTLESDTPAPLLRIIPVTGDFKKDD